MTSNGNSLNKCDVDECSNFRNQEEAGSSVDSEGKKSKRKRYGRNKQR